MTFERIPATAPVRPTQEGDGFHVLTVVSLEREIDGDAASVSFEVPPDLAPCFVWSAGQHLTLQLVVDGQKIRRCYTISNPPGQPLRVTVKRASQGGVSAYICDKLVVGDRVEVMPPSGNFELVADRRLRRTHYFFGAGSGITPLFAMINEMLTAEPYSTAHLIYGNSDAGSILFRQQLEELAQIYPGRFTLRHVLSEPSMWHWLTPWRQGRVDAAAIKAALTETPPVAQDVQYWICGPGRMNADVTSALMALDVPRSRIHLENFGAGTQQDTSVTGVAATARVTLNGRTQDLAIAADQTLLEAARAAGLSPPFHCQSGVCGACKARLTRGEVHMRAQMALQEEEIEQGVILTCQSVALADQIDVCFEG
ncbi:2Fe-2S iron-sulfur cluster-binding protein [Pseudophaeobacter sp.]|uniref:2Fe-2S iron-sulfur cluster-binding protein n=1 Tax=Pseudophaeobacter sp. TaxID=1971739 RepID=UPI003299F27F